jgi:cell division protein FtsL
MNLLAAAATTPAQPVSAYQNQSYQGQGYQNTTQQPDRPAQQQPSMKAKVLGYGYLLFNVAVVVFVIVMVYRFVKAFEKIAGSLDKGIVIRKDDTTT